MKTTVIRRIVKIDEEKCDGCGLCIPHCKEGALGIIDGKARLVGESYCDGLGACLGQCPRGAITIEEREAEDFDGAAVREHPAKPTSPSEPASHVWTEHSCPSAKVMSFENGTRFSLRPGELSSAKPESALSHWPVQLALVPVGAPYLRQADLLIAADCVPVAYPRFHSDLLEGRIVLVGCPKLDDVEPYLRKLARIFAECEIKSVTVAHMEVPCCFGVRRLVQEAMGLAGKEILLREVTISVRGEICGDVCVRR